MGITGRRYFFVTHFRLVSRWLLSPYSYGNFLYWNVFGSISAPVSVAIKLHNRHFQSITSLIECSRTIRTGRRATREFSFQLLKPEAPHWTRTAHPTIAPTFGSVVEENGPLSITILVMWVLLETTIGEDREEGNLPYSKAVSFPSGEYYLTCDSGNRLWCS